MTSFSILLFLVVVMVTLVSGIRIKVLYEPENDITCYTCPRKANNTECNKWAPDVYCPFEHTVCKSVNRINKLTGESVYVEKLCALPSECSLDTLGCKESEDGEELECTSCCTDSYCNRAVPTSVTSSISLSDSVVLSSASPVSPPHVAALAVIGSSLGVLYTLTLS